VSRFADRVQMTTATTGTGTITLGSASASYQTFAAAGIPTGTVVSYGILDGNNWETGTGTYTASGTTLTRSVVSSSNSNTTISLSGNAVVYITPNWKDLNVQSQYFFTSSASTPDSTISVTANNTLSIATGGNNAIVIASNQVVTSNASFAGNFAQSFSSQSANFTAALNTAYFITGNGVNVALPSTTSTTFPYVKLTNCDNKTGCVVIPAANQTIMGTSGNMNCDPTYWSFTLTWNNASNDWVIN
jgi:hypothetical protein